MGTTTLPVPDTDTTPGTGVGTDLEELFQQGLPPCEVEYALICSAGHDHGHSFCGKPSVSVMTVTCPRDGFLAQRAVCASCRATFQATPGQWACDQPGCGARVVLTFA